MIKVRFPCLFKALIIFGDLFCKKINKAVENLLINPIIRFIIFFALTGAV